MRAALLSGTGVGRRQARQGASLVGECPREREVGRDAGLELGAAARAQAIVGERDEIGLVGRVEFESARSSPAHKDAAARPAFPNRLAWAGRR